MDVLLLPILYNIFIFRINTAHFLLPCHSLSHTVSLCQMIDDESLWEKCCQELTLKEDSCMTKGRCSPFSNIFALRKTLSMKGTAIFYFFSLSSLVTLSWNSFANCHHSVVHLSFCFFPLKIVRLITLNFSTFNCSFFTFPPCRWWCDLVISKHYWRRQQKVTGKHWLSFSLATFHYPHHRQLISSTSQALHRWRLALLLQNTSHPNPNVTRIGESFYYLLFTCVLPSVCHVFFTVVISI